MNKAGCLLAGAFVACGTAASGPRRFDQQLANDFVGTWVTRLSLSQPYPLGPEIADRPSICGTIGFVEDHSTVRGDSGAREMAMIGVYDLDLRRLGLNWLDENSLPTAFAIARRNTLLMQGPLDSIRIVIKTGSDERITLLGGYDASGINGDWSAQSSRGAASGAFSMRRLGAAGPSCPPR